MHSHTPIYNWYLLCGEVCGASDHEKRDVESLKHSDENCASWSSRQRGSGRYLRVLGTGSTWERPLSISLLLRTISNSLFSDTCGELIKINLCVVVCCWYEHSIFLFRARVTGIFINAKYIYYKKIMRKFVMIW